MFKRENMKIMRLALEEIVQNSELHGKWVNTLSYLENCGARLIAECEHPTIVPKEMLKHAAEEFRHAYYLKSQISKVDSNERATYELPEVLGGYPAKHYLNRLNVQISRFLKKRGVEGGKLREYGYLLVTYAIEIRAESLYPMYQEILKAHDCPISMISIIREEEQHLAEINDELEESPAGAWRQQVCEIESELFETLLNEINKTCLVR
jgi:hypothetical protein